MRAKQDELVVTGMAVICNLGHELEAIAQHIRSKGPGVFVDYPDARERDLACTVCGMAPDPPDDEALGIERRESRFMGRAARLALWASRKALAQSQLDPTEAAVIVGSGTGDVAAHIQLGDRIHKTGSARRAPATLIPRIMASTVSANLSNALRTRGPSVSATAACAGGAWNLALAGMLIDGGAADVAIAGGVEVRDLHFHAGFDRIQAYNSSENDDPRNASRPYAADREGFLFSEGAGVVVLERRSHAEARGATVLGTLRGWGMSSDGKGEMVAPSAEGATRSMRAALRNAGVTADQIEYVSTHATSTPAGDVSEVEALREVFGRLVPYSSIKGYTGHSVSGAGAIEAILTWYALREGWLPPCRGAEDLDPALVDYPPVREAVATEAKLALSNSFGFGGTNATLVLGV